MTRTKYPELSMVVFVSQEKDNLLPIIENRPPALFQIAGKKILEWFYEIGKKFGVKQIILLTSKKDRSVLYDQLESFMETSAPFGEIGPFTIVDYEPTKGISQVLWNNSSLSSISKHSLWIDGNVIFSEQFLADFLKKAIGSGKYALVDTDEEGDYKESLGIAFFDERYLEQSVIKAKCVNDIFSDVRKRVASATIGLHFEQGKIEFWQLNYPWNLLDANQELIKQTTKKIDGTIEDCVTLIGDIAIGKGTRIRAGSYLEGPLVIGEDCDIGPNCYLRKGVSLGNKVRIGNACEMKNTIVFDGTHIAHLSYVGDSIIGANCNFGAGTITGNLRLDDQTVKTQLESSIHLTGRRKLGVIMGDNVKTAINVFFMPGVIVGNNSAIGTGVIVQRNIASGKFVYTEQETKTREWKIKPKK